MSNLSDYKKAAQELATPQHKDTTLDEILFELANYAHGIGAASGYGVFVGGEPQKKAKQALLQWRDKAVVEAYNKGRQTEARHTVDYMELNDFSRDVVLAHTKRRLAKIETALKETPNED